MDTIGNESTAGDSTQSVVAKLACSMVGSPLSWWIVIILSLCVMEKFELGVHSLPWNYYWRRKKRDLSPIHTTADWFSRHGEFEDTDGSSDNSHPSSNGVGHLNGLGRPLVPLQFKKFIRLQVVPRFRMQCKNNDGRFAMLVLTHMRSLREIQSLEFRQITFNGKPLVDPSVTTYPESYRLENYVVAQGTSTEHPEVSIAKQIPVLLAGFGKAERCFLRDPVPRTGILYCWEMPCSDCTGLLIDSLSGVCRKKTILAYSQDDPKDGKKNFQRLVDAGISVIKITA